MFRSEDNGTVQADGTGMGAALVPLLTVDEADERVAVILAIAPPRLIGIAWHRDRRPRRRSRRSSRPASHSAPASKAAADGSGL